MKLFFALILLSATILVMLSYSDKSNGETKTLMGGQNVIESLVQLKSEEKFVEDLSKLYSGAPDENIRVAAQSIIDSAINRLINISDKQISEVEFWEILEYAASELKSMDSEEMERGLAYMEDLMDIYEIESSDGRLNLWRYGFEPSSGH